MNHTRRGRITRVTGAFLLLGLWTCSDGPSNEGNNSISDPEVFEEAAREGFVPMVAGIADALLRLSIAVDGGPADGVVITPTVGGADFVMAVDFDGNATREGSIAGSFTGDIATGATLTIDDVSGNEPSLTGSGGFTATETAPGVVLLDDMSGSGESDPSGSRNAAEVEVTDGAVSLDVAAGVPTGFVDFDVTGEGETTSISVTFASDGLGGFTVHITGPGIDFTIP